MRFAPVFVLAPARSYSSVIVTMLGQHPSLYGFPELALFRAETVARLLSDPPNWRGTPTRTRMAGLLRALALRHHGEQSPDAVVRAYSWLECRRGWTVAHVLDHLLTGVAPLTGIEKSPESSAHEDFLARVCAAYPRARFLHVVRHPTTSIQSMYRVWKDLGYWNVTPGLFGQFCLGVWLHQHSRIARLGARLPPDRFLRVRSEELLTNPFQVLEELCRWLGIDYAPECIAPMLHPERSPFAQVGPEGATGGQDPDFLASPVIRHVGTPSVIEFPRDWVLDPWTVVAVARLAEHFGYTRPATDGRSCKTGIDPDGPPEMHELLA